MHSIWITFLLSLGNNQSKWQLYLHIRHIGAPWDCGHTESNAISLGSFMCGKMPETHYRVISVQRYTVVKQNGGD